MSPRGLTQPAPLQEDAEREIVEYSAEIVRVIAQGAELGRKQGRADMLSEVIRHVNKALNTAAEDHPGMPVECLNGFKLALHELGFWLSLLAAEETR